MTGQAWVWVILAIIVALLVGWVISRNRGSATVRSSAPAAAPPAAPPNEEAPVAATAAVAPSTAAPAEPRPSEQPLERASDPALAALDSATPLGAPAHVAAAPPAPPVPGAALPNADGSAPSGGYTIKAVDASKRFHDSSSPVYSVVQADLYFRDPEDATAAGFQNWVLGRKVAVPAAAASPHAAAAPTPAAPVAPYAGSVLAEADGSAPVAGYAIKAVTGSKRFHDACSPVYAVLRADLYFRDAEDASAAGFRYWKAGKKRAVAATPAEPAEPEAPFPGAALPNADGSEPSDEYVIKAVMRSKRYHDSRSPVYSVLRADVLFRDPERAAAAGFAYWKGGGTGAAPDDAPAPVAPHPGSALPGTDGSVPAGYRIKAVEGSKRYHDPSSPVYEVLRADVLFRDPDAARAAGYRYWRTKR